MVQYGGVHHTTIDLHVNYSADPFIKEPRSNRRGRYNFSF